MERRASLRRSLRNRVTGKAMRELYLKILNNLFGCQQSAIGVRPIIASASP